MKKMAIVALIVMCVVFIVGLVLIFSAPTMGLQAGNAAVTNNGGSMDTNQFEIIINGTTASYQIVGLAISLVSGFGLLACGYVLYKEI